MNENINNLSDVFFEIGNVLKIYEKNTKIEKIKNEKDQLYSLSEVSQIYPKLTKYVLKNAINEGLLPVTTIGNTRYVHLKDIDNFIEYKTERTYESLKAWREPIVK